VKWSVDQDIKLWGKVLDNNKKPVGIIKIIIRKKSKVKTP